jgi:hypothetical protein
VSVELREAYETIRDPGRWCQREIRVVDAITGLERFCASGIVATKNVPALEMHRLNEVARELFPMSAGPGGFGSVVWVNDVLGHEAVLQVFEKVLAEEGMPG